MKLHKPMKPSPQSGPHSNNLACIPLAPSAVVIPRRFNSSATLRADRPDNSSKTPRRASARSAASRFVMSDCSRLPPKRTPLALARPRAAFPLDAMPLTMTDNAQRYQVGLVVTAAIGASHKMMMVEVLGVVVTTGNTECQAHPVCRDAPDPV
jgi:hypothetical protein